ncbi:DUF6717 family protein [Aridibaculum aurantiacum]|uniref:DUF6717 family protein n=1 Tax=Aridibaculum aurantiacum TaxID=2810307 RepID=UPI001A963C2E|nr:DUF6717 family protein [Aridibaculum aurantiacum]
MKKDKTKNQVNVIHPYRTSHGTWVYDDPDVPVYAEAFVMGSSELIDMVVGKEVNHFTAYISEQPLPNASVILDNVDEQVGDGIKGWYEWRGKGHRNWFCGHLTDYFTGYPKTIYISIANTRA